MKKKDGTESTKVKVIMLESLKISKIHVMCRQRSQEGKSTPILGYLTQGEHITCSHEESGSAHIRLSKVDRFVWETIQCIRLLVLATFA